MMNTRRVAIRALLVSLATLAAPAVASADVTVAIDNGVRHQTIEGYGATTVSLIFGPTDNVPPALRAQAIDAVYNQVKLNMGNLEVGPFESPATALYSPANDDNDPNTINPAGFNWTQSDNMMNGVVQPAAPFGFDNYYIGPAMSEGYEFAWARALRSSDYNRYLDECAEHVAALAIHWRDAYGITPRFMQLWNEPLSGNTEMPGATMQELADIVARAGARLRREGFASMKFVVPADETEQISLDEARAILSDANARPYVGAVAYHPYPYGSTYASVPNILSTSGSGSPDPGKVAVRNALRDLGAQYGVPVFMVEVSHSELSYGNFDGARGRAIQIHDEMVYADAAAFFGMNAMWDSVTNDQHYAGRTNPGLFAESDTIALIDDAAGRVYISEMGRAIGHYARWVPRGSVRIDATSNDPLVQVAAFRDDSAARVVLVAINNASASRTLQVGVAGLTLDAARALVGEQSTSAAYWQPVTGIVPTSAGWSVTLPAQSITTLAGVVQGVDPTRDAGVPPWDAATGDAGTAPVDAGCAGAVCGGACVDLQTDGNNCGACGTAVCHTEVCSSGAPACAPGRTACGTTFGCLGCKDLSSDPANCGACGQACAANEVCAAGRCGAACPTGTTMCGQACTDTQTDVLNCGGCGPATMCNPGEYCVAGACSRSPTGAQDAGVAVDAGARSDGAVRSDGGVAVSDAGAAMDGGSSGADSGAAVDGGGGGGQQGGCGCRTMGGARTHAGEALAVAAVAMAFIGRRRRARVVRGAGTLLE